MAARMGIGTRELQEFQHAARDTGVNLEALETGIRNLSRNLDEAANDSAQAREAFARLGVSWRDSMGNVRDVVDVLNDVADSLNLKTQAERAALAVQLFGRSGTQLIPLLKEGSKGMAALRAETQQLGQVLSDDALKALDDMQDSFDKATNSIKVGFMKAVVEAKPVLDGIAIVLTNIGNAMAAIAEKVGPVASFFSSLIGFGRIKPIPEPEAFGPFGEKFGPPLPPKASGAPALTIAQRIQQAQAAAAAAQNRLAIAGAASLAAPGSQVDLLQRQITLSQQKVRLDLDGLAAQRALELTDKGRLELAQKAEKVVTDFIVEQIRLTKELEDATQAAAAAEANLFDFSGEAGAAQRDLDVAADAAGRYAEALKEAKRQGLGIGESEVLFDVPLMSSADATMQKLGSRLNDIANQSRVMGFSVDETGKRIAALDEALQALADDGISETDEGLQSIRSELERLTVTRDALSDIFGGLRSAVSGTVQGIVQGTLTMREAFANMGRSIAASILENVINRGLLVAQRALEEFIDSLVRSGLIQSTVRSGVGLLTSILGGAAGGAGGFDAGGALAAGGGAGAVAPHLASGGIVTSPTFAMIGEGGPEAVIPLNRLGMGGGTQVVIHNYTAATVEHTESRGPDGQEVHNFVIRELRRSIQSGEMDKILSPYALSRQPVRR
jgi:hypothetical protein